MNGSEKGTSPNTEVELHFNYWSLKEKRKWYSPLRLLPENKGKIRYLDIGVRITNASDSESVNFYLPFEITSMVYRHELGEKICKNNELISAVFNCPIESISPQRSTAYCDIDFSQKKDERPIRFFTQLEVSSKGVKIEPITTEKRHKGCVITFPKSIFEHTEGRDSYFRFRIELSQSDEKSILNVDKPFFRAVTNDHEVSEIVDFRINETRNLPVEVSKQLTSSASLKKIHFFLIRDSRSEHKMSDANYKRCRILENDLWGEYLELDPERKARKFDDPMLIYHWVSSDKNGIDHFATFSKFSSKPIRWPQMWAVIFVSLLTGFAASFFTNYVWQFVDNSVGYDDNNESVSKKMINALKVEQKSDTDKTPPTEEGSK
jgi:hypothetical protein